MNRLILAAALPMLTCALLLSACGGEPAPPPPPPPVKDTVLGDAVGTMDRARAVEDVTMEHKQDVDRALEQADGKGAAAGSP